MFGSIERGWSLTKSCFKVLSLDKEIIAMPVLTAISLLAIWAIGIGGIASGIVQSMGLLGLVLVFGLYVLSYAVGIFFQAATIEMATIRFNGGNPVMKDGLRKAWSRAGRIFQWAVLAATVGIILQILRDQARDSFIARLLVNMLDMAWGIATFFVVPVLVFQGVGPFDAIKGSMSTVKRTFGEGTVGIISTTIIFFVAAIPGFILLFLAFGMMVSPGVQLALITVAVVYLLAVWAVASAIRGIMLAALYKYSVEGRLPGVMEQGGLDASQLAW